MAKVGQEESVRNPEEVADDRPVLVLYETFFNSASVAPPTTAADGVSTSVLCGLTPSGVLDGSAAPDRKGKPRWVFYSAWDSAESRASP